MTTPPGLPPLPPGPGRPFAPRPPVRAPYDGVSVAALASGLTCCAAPVAVVLGIVGLVRTTDGRRRGLWAAVTGLVLGVAGMVVWVVVLIGGTVALLGTTSEGDAVPGDCLDVTRAFDGTDVRWSDCYAPHDAEVLAAGRLGHVGAARAAELSGEAWCRKALDPALLDLVREKDLELGFSTDAVDPDVPEAGDAWICWAERSDHHKLEAPLVDRGYGPEPPQEA